MTSVVGSIDSMDVIVDWICVFLFFARFIVHRGSMNGGRFEHDFIVDLTMFHCTERRKSLPKIRFIF